MKFTRAYREALRFFPSEIDVSDGQWTELGGAYFLNLSKIWDHAERMADNWSLWHQLLVWAIFGAFHDQAKEALSNYEDTIYKADINKRVVEEVFSENLLSNELKYPRQMRREYLRGCKGYSRPSRHPMHKKFHCR